jgi:hypothetical protein
MEKVPDRFTVSVLAMAKANTVDGRAWRCDESLISMNNGILQQA